MGVSKVVYGNDTLVDLTGDTVTPTSLTLGATAHGADGEPIVGEYQYVLPPMSSDIRGGARIQPDSGLEITDTDNLRVRLALESDGTVRGGISQLTAKGHAEQDGTPTPDSPVEIQVVTGHTVTGKTGRFVDLEAHGRNLLPYSSVDLTSDRSAILWNNNREELPAGTYTVSITPLDIMPLFQLMYTDGTNKSLTIGLSGVLVFEAEKPFKRIYWYISTTDWNNGKRVVLDNIMFEKDSVVHPYQPYYHTTTPIPLPSRGWVAGLPDGTADALRLDGAGHVEWTLKDAETTTAATDGVTGTIGVDVLSTTGQIADGATVLYKLATPVTEDCGYVEDWPTDIPDGATVTIPELDEVGIRYFVDSAVTELAKQWYARAEATIGQAVVELAARVANLENA